MDDQTFDTLADAELAALTQRLDQFDPDELEADLSMGVLTITLGGGGKIIINSHRAAGQIWMAAFRHAWHFSPRVEGERTVWRTDREELRATLAAQLSERCGRSIAL